MFLTLCNYTILIYPRGNLIEILIEFSSHRGSGFPWKIDENITFIYIRVMASRGIESLDTLIHEYFVGS